MLISIIIPTYAPGEYIYDCLNSLSVQTSGPGSFEVIVILNGIKEPYFSDIQAYLIEHDFKFKLLYTDEPGVSNARNIGLDAIEQLDTHYVVFLDDDDKLSPNFIEEVAGKAQPDTVVASNSKSFFDGQNTTHEGYISKCYEENRHSTYNIFKYRCFLSTVWGKLFPLAVIGKTRFNKNFSIGEDCLFGFEVSNKIKAIVLTSDDAYCFRRLRLTSVSRKKRSRLSKFKNGCKLCIAYSRAYLKSPFEYNFLFYISRIVATFMHVIKQGNPAALDHLIKKESQKNTVSGN